MIRTIAIITHFASPYQVELFNAIQESRQISLLLLYLRLTSPHRQWTSAAINHPHMLLDSRDATLEPTSSTESASLVIFNYYRHSQITRLLNQRSKSGKPWVFWGERTGFHGWPLLGRFYRCWTLRCLHKQNVPIWGIGKLAVDSYRSEFGKNRSYVNLPYFSDLKRFAASPLRLPISNPPSPISSRSPSSSAFRAFLFSGSLIPRKGLDLLVRSFLRVAAEFPESRLRILGDGPLADWARGETESLGSRCEFLGFRDWPDLPAVYATGDILVAPSRHDGWGLIVPEALAAGLPVITTDRTGAGVEFIRPGYNGWLIKAGETGQLYSAMKAALLLDDTSLRRMSENARESIAEHSLENGVSRFIAAAESAISETLKRPDPDSLVSRRRERTEDRG